MRLCLGHAAAPPPQPRHLEAAQVHLVVLLGVRPRRLLLHARRDLHLGEARLQVGDRRPHGRLLLGGGVPDGGAVLRLRPARRVVLPEEDLRAGGGWRAGGGTAVYGGARDRRRWRRWERRCAAEQRATAARSGAPPAGARRRCAMGRTRRASPPCARRRRTLTRTSGWACGRRSTQRASSQHREALRTKPPAPRRRQAPGVAIMCTREPAAGQED